MSQQQDLQEEVAIGSINLYLDVATTVWLFYELLLTLSWERRCVWQRRVSAVTVVFFAARYLTLLKQGLKLVRFVKWAGLSGSGSGLLACSLLLRADAVLTSALYVNVSVFSALRMYAISGRNAQLAALVFGLGMIHVCTDAYTNNLGRFVPLLPPLAGCVQIVAPAIHPSAILYENLPYTPTYRAAVYIGTACTLLPELILQIYTWRKTLKIRRKLRSQHMDDSLFALLLRDGAISYLLLTFWSILTRVVTRVDLYAMGLPGLSVILCRFLLSLREVGLSQQTSSTTRDTCISRIVGNAGASLHTVLETEPMFEHEHKIEEEVSQILNNSLLVIGLHSDDEKLIHSDTLADV